MPFNLAAVLSVTTGALLAAVTFATVRVSRRFFQQLIEQHPELANSFSRPMMGTRYGPLLPSKTDYLKEKRFKDLSDPALRQLGQLSLRLLTVHAVAFAAFFICVSWWSITRHRP
jgi:hypothetical protein